MARATGLSDDQRFSLMKFRHSISDVARPDYDDQFLLRWLRARDWNSAAAETMLRESLRWRETWQADTIQDWVPPQALQDYYPSGLSGFDKEGAPVVVIPFSGLDIFGLLHTITKRDFILMTIQQMEKYMSLSGERVKECGEGARGVVGIIDMEGFVLRQWAWKPAAEVVISLLQMYEANYPEILKSCFIINAPKVFSLAWSVVKNFLNDHTQSKIHIYKADPNKWMPPLLQLVSPDQLPVHYGGLMEGPPGDPRCSNKIKQGGKVPKELYKKHGDIDKLVSSLKLQTTVIKKGGKLRLDYIAAEPGSFLKWDFRTEGHDIKFGVTMKDIDGKSSTIIPLKRVSSHLMEEVGVVSCPQPATYTVLFDNTYSYLRNKKLHYSVVMAPPLATVSANTMDEINDNVVAKTV